jgi:hypothetical protein
MKLSLMINLGLIRGAPGEGEAVLLMAPHLVEDASSPAGQVHNEDEAHFAAEGRHLGVIGVQGQAEDAELAVEDLPGAVSHQIPGHQVPCPHHIVREIHSLQIHLVPQARTIFESVENLQKKIFISWTRLLFFKIRNRKLY